jgi:hypothetical protein
MLKGQKHMSALPLRKIALMLLVCLSAVFLLSLPTQAMMRERQPRMAESVTDMPPSGEGLDENALYPNPERPMARNNLGDTDGDGKIEGQNTPSKEHDPIQAIEEMAQQEGGWVTLAFCIAAIIALVLIIVALIPKKHI